MAKTRLALSYWGMIAAYLILNVPRESVLMGTFFLSIPRELEEAAEVDGASRVQTFFRIITPISTRLRLRGDYHLYPGLE